MLAKRITNHETWFSGNPMSKKKTKKKKQDNPIISGFLWLPQLRRIWISNLDINDLNSKYCSYNIKLTPISLKYDFKILWSFYMRKKI